MTGLPAALPLVARALAPRRRPDWRAAGPIVVEARDVWLDPGRVDGFLSVCGGADPPQLPLTFPYALLTPLHLAVVADPGFPLVPWGLVHQGERIRRHRAIAVGTRVDVRCTVPAFEDTPAGVAFDLVTEVFQAGERIWDSRTRALRRRSGAPRPYTGDAPRTPLVGAWSVPGGTGRRYGWVSGNLDPIHVSRFTAWPFGFRKAVVHGMWTVARAVAQLEEPTGAATLHVRFRSVLQAPTRVTLAAAPDGDGRRFAVWGPDAARPVLEGGLWPRVADDGSADVS